MQPLVVQVENTPERSAQTFAFMKSPVRIGRNPLNDLQLDHPFVSQWHAVIRFNDKQSSYLDLGSTNRTVIDGRPIDRNVEVTLTQDMDIRIGTLRLHVIRGSAPADLLARSRKGALMAGALDPGHDLPHTIALPKVEPAADEPQTLIGVGARPLAPPSGSAPPTRLSLQSMRADASAHASDFEAQRARYESARTAFQSAAEAHLRSLPEASRPAREAALRAQYPELFPEAPGNGHTVRKPASPSADAALEAWFRKLTGGRFPQGRQSVDVTQALDRVSGVLERFALGLIELLRAQDQFGRQMSLEQHAEESALRRATDPQTVLAYLIGADDGAQMRLTELSRALADITLHQVGLISAAIEGGRALVEMLAPSTLANQPLPPANAPALDRYGKISKPGLFQARHLWRRYLVAHFDLHESDRFVRELFGREFVRRYYAITGGASSTSDRAAARRV